MLKSGCKLVILSLIAALVLPAAGVVNGAAGSPPAPGQPHAGVQAPQAPSSVSWYDGLIQYSTITNCFSIIQGSPYTEYGAGTYVGFSADPNNSQPAPNAPYYAHVVIYGLGNSCAGMRAYLDLALPANTALSISPAHPVYCFYDGVQFTAPDCPQTLPASSFNPGAFEILSTDAAHANTWPMPQGHVLEFQVPLVSSTALTNSPLQANVWMLDGNSSPWLRPQEGVYVFSNSGGTATIIYPSPSTLTVTATTAAHSQAYLYTSLSGMGYFDLGTTPSYGLIQDPVSIPVGGPAWLVWEDWALALLPDTLYHWRFWFRDSNSQDHFGPDQTFRTLPDGQVTIGSGTPGSCTALGFETALPSAKSIKFNCGALPITLTLSAPQPINSNVTIDGGNKVTLDAGGTGQHFGVQAGAALTLTAITLVNGSTFDCGGAVEVAGNAHLTLSQARFFNNYSGYQGGAVCIRTNGSASIASSLFRGNHAGAHGGAIGNYGTATITGTRFVSNIADTNGGGIDTTVFAAITTTTFVSNTAGYRGGGINNYTGLLKISATSFISNTAGLYGGGLSNDSNGTLVSSTTLFDNYSSNNGGGIESSGTLTLTNSTLSANRAKLNGGGIYWATSQAITLTLLNDTVVNNTAGTQGGNFSVGGVLTSPIALKNTLVAFGSPNNCDHTVATQGHNLDSTNGCGLSAGSDVRNANPKIGVLRDNGGPTWTYALQGGSPALDAGANSGCPVTDQRGTPRPQDGDGNGSSICDIGAYEALPGSALWVTFLPFIRRAP
jgi:predicted outer membrane repeat protein